MSKHSGFVSRHHKPLQQPNRNACYNSTANPGCCLKNSTILALPDGSGYLGAVRKFATNNRNVARRRSISPPTMLGAGVREESGLRKRAAEQPKVFCSVYKTRFGRVFLVPINRVIFRLHFNSGKNLFHSLMAAKHRQQQTVGCAYIQAN